MTPHEFIRKWKPVALTERQTAQEHFIDLCRLVNHPTPVEEDPSGERYCFEKGALKSSGRPGFADVWKKGHFDASSASEPRGSRRDQFHSRRHQPAHARSYRGGKKNFRGLE